MATKLANGVRFGDKMGTFDAFPSLKKPLGPVESKMVGFLSFEFIEGFFPEDVKFKNGFAAFALPPEGLGRLVAGVGLNMEIEGLASVLFSPPMLENRPLP